ncbi:hypothetical protein BHM03_00036824 [Ensete ventricosum]|nr:hypothetical protein BHM03_00036824 [Ensete ventricosum]
MSSTCVATVTPNASWTIMLLLPPLTLCLLFLCLIYYLLSRAFLTGSRSRLPLPPGSMGWPYIGETLQLYSNNPNAFFALKQKRFVASALSVEKDCCPCPISFFVTAHNAAGGDGVCRYGPIFKTHILGCPCVMVSSPEAARFVLVTRAHLFKPTFPASKERMLGPQAIFFQQGDYHARLRRLVLRAFMPDAIRGSVAGIEAVALRALRSWDGRLVNTFQEMKTNRFFFDALLLLFRCVSVVCLSVLMRVHCFPACYYTLEKGYNSMPINLPGTLFYKAMKARKQLAQIVAKIVSSRRTQWKTEANGLLGSFMEAKEALTDDQIADNIIGVIFAARDTTASVLTWIVKYLGENPGILRAVMVRCFLLLLLPLVFKCRFQ